MTYPGGIPGGKGGIAPAGGEIPGGIGGVVPGGNGLAGMGMGGATPGGGTPDAGTGAAAYAWGAALYTALDSLGGGFSGPTDTPISALWTSN